MINVPGDNDLLSSFFMPAISCWNFIFMELLFMKNKLFSFILILFLAIIICGFAGCAFDSDIPEIKEDGYAYQQLSTKEQQIYAQILTCINSYTTTVKVKADSIEELHNVYQHVLADHGELFWIAGYTYKIHHIGDKTLWIDFAPDYTMGEKEVKDLLARVDKIVEQILEPAPVRMTDYEKAKLVFDYLAWNIDYSGESVNNQNMLSVFLEKKSVCKGYASAAQYMLKKLYVPCTIITGESKGVAHAWNLIKLDGEYYYMDTTWGSYDFTFRAEQDQYIQYGYMAMTTEDMLSNHTPDDLLELPNCTTRDDCYYTHENLEFRRADYDLIDQKIQTVYNSDTKHKTLSMRFDTEEELNRVVDHYVYEQEIRDLCPEITRLLYTVNPEFNILIFML